MKVIIAGGRHFDDYELLQTAMSQFIREIEPTSIEVVSGGARGADALGEHWAKDRGYPLTVFKADWDKYGKSAGYRRNAEMAEYADACMCFWDGESKGTKHMIDLSIKKNLISYTERY